MTRKYSMIFLLTAVPMILGAVDFGSAGALDAEDFSLEAMLEYAWEDEHMALAEYEAIMEEFDVTRPYANIARSEETHITYLKDLYDSYGIEYPDVDTKSHLVVPGSLEEAASLGVEAEINNIAMYEKFLKTDLPDDVAQVFTALMNGSENHLSAFQRQVAMAPGRGRRR